MDANKAKKNRDTLIGQADDRNVHQNLDNYDALKDLSMKKS